MEVNVRREDLGRGLHHLQGVVERRTTHAALVQNVLDREALVAPFPDQRDQRLQQQLACPLDTFVGTLVSNGHQVFLNRSDAVVRNRTEIGILCRLSGQRHSMLDSMTRNKELESAARFHA